MVKQVDHYLPQVYIYLTSYNPLLAIFRVFQVQTCVQVCTVIREGVRQRVRAEDLAIGDVVELKAGDRVAADMRIISSNGLKAR